MLPSTVSFEPLNWPEPQNVHASSVSGRASYAREERVDLNTDIIEPRRMDPCMLNSVAVL